MIKFNVLVHMVFIALMSSNAQAEVFVDVDRFGNKVYTNINPNHELRPSIDEPAAAKKPHKKTSKVDFPVVSKKQQAKRDETRAAILNAELATEKKALATAKQKKDDAAQKMHARNITLLERELGLSK